MKVFTAHMISYDHYEFEEFIGVYKSCEDFYTHLVELLRGANAYKYEDLEIHNYTSENKPQSVEEEAVLCLGEHIQLVCHVL